MKENILKLRFEGKSYNEIQKILSCSKGTISYYCGKGQKEKSKNNLKSRRRKLRNAIDDIKKTLNCNNCKENRWWLLDFHHTDPSTKENTVSKLVRTSNKEKVLDEIKKCEVLCANCHRDLHYKEKIKL